MTLVQTGSAPEEPVKPVTLLSSKPSHTTAKLLPEYPANHESRVSLVVPDLPARLRSVGKLLYADLPVPDDITRCKP